ncbi:MAG: trimethylguanosine synthase [Sandaracinaceae bacterium]|nr:trimethylguanosine synthase [Sandaracinaceae bacterium]
MSDPERERALVAGALPDRGPFEEDASIELPGAPRVFRGRGVLAWVASEARARAEREGLDRVPLDHPARPLALHEGRVLAFAPFVEAAELLAAARAWPGEPRAMEGTRGELLAGLSEPGDPGLARALARLGLRRRDADRWLGARVRVETDVGLSFGGVHPGWLRREGHRVVCLRCDRAREDGWRAVDLAGLALDPRVELDALRAAHGPGEARDEALAMALVLVGARQHALHGDASLADRVRAVVARAPEPERVRVWIEAPSFVDPRAWIEPGEEVPSSRARWLLANLDGLPVGGGRVAVRTEPPLRAGRRAPPREDRRARRRRLFSRWEEGVRADEEGLVSATPEALALRIARGARGVVLDGTCGVGALAIAYARQPEVTRVIAVDLDAERLAMAAHNARIYGVAGCIDFVRGDVLSQLGSARADLLVLDPPWGGRAYDRDRVALEELGLDVRAALARFEGPIVLKLPRSFDVATLPGQGWQIEALVDERGILKMIVARRGAERDS